jgi:hypothetical protein
MLAESQIHGLPIFVYIFLLANTELCIPSLKQTSILVFIELVVLTP